MWLRGLRDGPARGGGAGAFCSPRGTGANPAASARPIGNLHPGPCLPPVPQGPRTRALSDLESPNPPRVPGLDAARPRRGPGPRAGRGWGREPARRGALYLQGPEKGQKRTRCARRRSRRMVGAGPCGGPGSPPLGLSPVWGCPVRPDRPPRLLPAPRPRQSARRRRPGGCAEGARRGARGRGGRRAAEARGARRPRGGRRGRAAGRAGRAGRRPWPRLRSRAPPAPGGKGGGAEAFRPRAPGLPPAADEPCVRALLPGEAATEGAARRGAVTRPRWRRVMERAACGGPRGRAGRAGALEALGPGTAAGDP